MRLEYALSRILCTVALTGTMTMSNHVDACLARSNTPDLDNPSQYHAIFAASVASFEWVPDVTSLMDITQSYKIRIFPNIRPIRGVAPEIDEIFVEGACGSPVPKRVNEVGIFFQRHAGGNITPLGYFRPDSERLVQYIERIRQAEAKQRQ